MFCLPEGVSNLMPLMREGNVCGAAMRQVKLQCDCRLTSSIIDLLSLFASRFLGGRNSRARSMRIIPVTFKQHTSERIRVQFQCLTVADGSKTTQIELRMKSLFLHHVKHFFTCERTVDEERRDRSQVLARTKLRLLALF